MQNQDGEYDIEGHKGDIEKLRIEVKKRDGIINSLKTDIEAQGKRVKEQIKKVG